jgi:hypothetical protein
MTRHTRRFPILSLVMGALLLGGAAAAMSAGQGGTKPAFTEAELFLELNDTDGDLGTSAQWYRSRSAATSSSSNGRVSSSVSIFRRR